jgi:hypothetical protein
MTQRKQAQITLTIEAYDALAFEADVLALKYDGTFYGVDAAVARLLFDDKDDLDYLLPKISGFRLLPSNNKIAANAVLFVGVKPEFGYQEVREFGRKVLDSLAGAAPETQHLLRIALGLALITAMLEPSCNIFFRDGLNGCANCSIQVLCSAWLMASHYGLYFQPAVLVGR